MLRDKVRQLELGQEVTTRMTEYVLLDVSDTEPQELLPNVLLRLSGRGRRDGEPYAGLVVLERGGELDKKLVFLPI